MPAAFADGDPDAATNGDAVGTLQAQINAAADNGATVQLTANTQESIVIPEGKSITLDLQSYILSNETGKHTIENHGTLTIMGTGTAVLSLIHICRSNMWRDQTPWRIFVSSGSRERTVISSAGATARTSCKIALRMLSSPALPKP